MRTDRTLFEPEEKGLAIEIALERGQEIDINMNGTIHVPLKNLKKKKKRKRKLR